MQFNHFLVRDDEPLLFHAGPRSSYPVLADAVARLLDPATLRWVAFSHFEADECGALNAWLERAPGALPLCTPLAADLNVNDFAVRPPRVLEAEELLATGRHRFRMVATPHLPHSWDAGMLFEDTDRTLFCSDLAFQPGDPPPLSSDVVGPARDALRAMRGTPFDHSIPYTAETDGLLEVLAGLRPATLAVMHGASFAGDGAAVVRELAAAYREVLGGGRRAVTTDR
jgi:flavorubredoxin